MLKPCIKMKKVFDRRKTSKILHEVKSVESISKNPQRFLEKNPMHKEVLASHKQQDDGYE